MTTPLFQFNENRADIEREVALRAVDGFAHTAGQDPARSYQLVLNDAAFHEINRLEKSRGKRPSVSMTGRISLDASAA